MNVVIYARFSSHRQNEQSIEGQLKECYAYAERNGYNVIGEYIDRAVSATNDNRQEFQKMVEDSKSGAFEAVLIYKLDRYARNRYDAAIYRSLLKKNGVKIISALENISDDPSGVILEAVLDGINEYYSLELAQKVKRGMNLNAEKCFFNGGFVPLGYKIKDIRIEELDCSKKIFVIDEATAHIVNKIFEMYATGNTILQIVDYLNSHGYKTSMGTTFKKNSLQSILKNRKYIGIYSYENIEVEDGLPAIVDKSLFYKVQDRMNKNKRAPARMKAKEEYILTTKLFCGHCKSPMVGISGTSSIKRIYYYYSCNDSRKRLCHKKNVKKEYIEDFVINQCRKLLINENIDMISKEIYEICKKESNNNGNLKYAERNLKEINKSLENLVKALEQGKNIDIISDRITLKRKEKAEAEKQIAIEKMKHTNLTIPQIKFFLTQLKKGDINDIKYRKTLINIFINSIYLYDKELTIILNIGNTPININLSLIEDIEKDNKKAKCLYLANVGSPLKNS